jgi:rod shape-determining protein MreD
MQILILLLSGFFFQILLAKFFAIGGISINIMLLLTIEIAVVEGANKGQVFGFFTGLLEDILTLGIIGIRSLIRTIIGFIVGNIKNQFDEGNVLFQIVLVFFIFLIHGFFIYFMRIIFSYPEIIIRNIFINALINGLLAPFIFFLVVRTSAR